MALQRGQQALFEALGRPLQGNPEGKNIDVALGLVTEMCVE